MKKAIIIVFTITLNVMAYSQTPDSIYKTVSNETMEWFIKGDWQQGVSAVPDASVDINAFHSHFVSHTQLWEILFTYFSQTDLLHLPKGRYALAGDSLFAIVDEYYTENEEARKFESHKKYIDLQYIISGEELIGVAKLDDAMVIDPYDGEKDIAFYSIPDSEYRMADDSVFFIFFPGDAHRPCVLVDQSAPVKKIVFKILSDQ